MYNVQVHEQLNMYMDHPSPLDKIADEEVSKVVHQKAAAFTNTINRAVNNMLAFGRKLGTNADLWKNGAASHTCSWRRPSLQLHLVIMMRTLTPVNGKKDTTTISLPYQRSV